MHGRTARALGRETRGQRVHGVADKRGCARYAIGANLNFPQPLWDTRSGPRRAHVNRDRSSEEVDHEIRSRSPKSGDHMSPGSSDMTVDPFRELVVELAGLGEVDALARLCSWSADALPVAGTGLALIIDNHHRGSLGASDDVAAHIEELQFRSGEGPCLDAHRTGNAVSETDLVHSDRWPLFGPDAVASGIAAIYALPMRIGFAGLGALDLYHDKTGPLPVSTMQDAQVVADIATALVLGYQANATNGLSQLLDDLFQHRSEVHQATGMASVQLDVGMADALVAVRAHAYATDRTVGAVATDIVTRTLRLEP